MQRDNSKRYDLIVSVRFSPVAFARLMRYWRQMGKDFSDRASMIRTTYETFLIEHNVPEPTTEEAIELLEDEVYHKTEKQRAVHKLTAKLTEKKLEQVSAFVQEFEETKIDLQSALNELEIEED